jgi:cobalt-zinc-cadmium efflux system outer membrane protein
MFPPLPTVLVVFVTVLFPAVAAGQSLRLEDAIQVAMQRNHDIKLARTAMDSAAAAITTAAAAPNPTLTVQTLNINPSAGIGSGPLRGKTVDSTVRVDQLIERGGKRELRMAVAALQQRAVRADMADLKRQLQRDVSSAYYDLLATQKRVGITSAASELAQHALHAAEQRHRAGDLSGSEAVRLRIDALHAHNDADDADAELDQARRALALLLGVEDSSTLVAIDPWPVALPNDAQLRTALELRADVVGARLRVDAARAARDLARAGRKRDVTVGLQFEHYPVSATNPQGTGNSFGIAVQVPLFVRYGMDGEVRSAEAGLDAASEALEKVRQNIAAEIGRTRAKLDAAARHVARYENDILPAAKKSLDAGEFAFEHGSTGVMDVLDVRRAWRSAQLEALAARADHAKSLAAFNAALSTEQAE